MTKLHIEVNKIRIREKVNAIDLKLGFPQVPAKLN